MTGVKRADEAVERSLALLQLTADPPATIATATRVVNASDSDDEVRCVVREVVETLRTTPAHRVAVLYAARSPYARLLHEHLGAAGRHDERGRGPPGRRARRCPRVAGDSRARRARRAASADLFQALANAPARDFAGARVPVSRWERISRAAGVVAGADWPTRLDAYIADRRAQVAVEQDGDDPRQWLIDRCHREADTAGAATRLRRPDARRTARRGRDVDVARPCRRGASSCSRRSSAPTTCCGSCRSRSSTPRRRSCRCCAA